MRGRSRYLLVLYIAERRGSAPIAPGVVADALDRSPAATTEALQRLEERGLVDREPYEGATLTREGREAAEELYESYVTLSQFFRDVLKLDDHEREAMRLAGSVSRNVTERLASTLLHGAESESRDGEPAPSFLANE